MSLLNEALKRLETDKSQTAIGEGDLPGLTPALDEDPTGGRSHWKAILVLAVVVLGGATWFVLREETSGMPSPAAATPLPGTDQTASPIPPPPPMIAKPRIRIQPDPAGTEGQETQATLAKTLDAIKYYQPLPPAGPPALDNPADGLATAAPAEEETARPRSAADSPATATPPASVTKPAPPVELAAVKPADPAEVAGPEETDDDRPAGAADPDPAAKEPTTQPAEAPIAAPAAPKKPALDPAKFQFSGTMQGPGGMVAIINGLFVTQGQTVDGAKVVRITAHSVDLEANGTQITLRFTQD